MATYRRKMAVDRGLRLSPVNVKDELRASAQEFWDQGKHHTARSSQMTMTCTQMPVVFNEPEVTSQCRISVDDIYATLERERAASRLASRDQTIDAAHCRLLHGRHVPPIERIGRGSAFRTTTPSGQQGSEIGTVADGRSATTLSSYSHLSAANSDILHISDPGDESYQGLSEQIRAPGYLRPGCIRARSAMDYETSLVIGSLPRQCCDVLGPKACHECAKLRRRRRRDSGRLHQSARHDGCLHLSADNLTSAVLVSRACPELASQDIEQGLARGDIIKPAFRANMDRLTARRRQSDNLHHHDGQRVPATSASGATYNFFSSIRDLSNKITSGKVARKVILTGNAEEDQAPKYESLKAIRTFSELVVPAFVSSRRVKSDKRSRHCAPFEPPLLPKVCQNVEPAFFAGSEAAYKLPDRLPENVVPNYDMGDGGATNN